ncbi:MAG: DUF308 domain-containing protein [Ileibacterium sp.]|mgnify:FL=1|nr:DUF308 domain-containing protein [Ileibacterium sp.]
MKTVLTIEKWTGIILLVISGVCLFLPNLEADVFYYCVAVTATLSAGGLWHNALIKKNGIGFLEAAAASAIALLFWFSHFERTWLILICFSFYMLFCGANELLQWVFNKRDHASGNWRHLLAGLLYLALSILSFAYRQDDVVLVMRYFGLYLLIQAVQLFLEIYYSKHPDSTRSLSLKNWVSLPVYIVSFLPGISLHLMMKSKYKNHPLQYDSRKNDEEVNLRVCIHSGLSGEKMMGHMTFSYKDVMYSYGNYAESEEKFFRSTGPGIFFTVPAEIYINNSCIYEHSTIFEYGLHITPEQEAKLQDILNGIFENTYRWECPLEADAQGRHNFAKYESDYSCRLFYRTGAKYRKFKSGQWKTYWILGDNCSLFAEDILSRIGCNIVHKTGIISPGEYFEFFETAYQDPKSNVITKSWHDASEPSTLYSTFA